MISLIFKNLYITRKIQILNSKVSLIIKNYTKNSVPDDQRLLLTNIPDLIHVDHLVLYLEYLSDEIAVERLDYCRELKNSIAVTFVRAIGSFQFDFLGII